YFDNRFRQLRGEAYSWQLWGAIYIIQGGCSDDGFTDFRDWVISRGKEFYYTAIANPAFLSEVAEEEIDVDWEGISYIPSSVFEELTGEEIPSEFEENQDIKGEPWDEDSDDLKKMFPELWERYSDDD